MKYHIEDTETIVVPHAECGEPSDWRVVDKSTGEKVSFARGFDTEAGTVTVFPKSPNGDFPETDREETLTIPFRVVNCRTSTTIAETA